MSSSNFFKHSNVLNKSQEDEAENEDEEQLISATFTHSLCPSTTFNEVVCTAENSTNFTRISINQHSSGPLSSPESTSPDHQKNCFFRAHNLAPPGSLLPPLSSAGSPASSLCSLSTNGSTRPLLSSTSFGAADNHICNTSLSTMGGLNKKLNCSSSCASFTTRKNISSRSTSGNTSTPCTVTTSTESPPFSASSSKQFSFSSTQQANGVDSNLDSTSSLQNHIFKLNLDQLNNANQMAPSDLISSPQMCNGPNASLSNGEVKRLLNGCSSTVGNTNTVAAGHSRPLSLYEKRYLLAVERGDLAGVRRMIELAAQMAANDVNAPAQFNINCTDPLGRSALLMAIDNENLDMIELLVECGVEMRDSLLHAINEEFVEAVELLLDYEEALQRNRALAERTSPSAIGNDQNLTGEYRFDCRPTLLPGSGAQSVNSSREYPPAMLPPVGPGGAGVHQLSSQSTTGSTITSSICTAITSLVSGTISPPALSNVPQVSTGEQMPSSQPAITTSSSTFFPSSQYLYSWEGFERETFTSDVTPLILAAHKNNYEIIKLLLDRGISPLPCPHDARCGCRECTAALQSDCLRYSRSRINAYRALASPSLIALSSRDPIHTAFELSWQLRRLSFLEPEFKSEYVELRKQCQAFATALLDHTRTHHELEVLLNYEPEPSVYQMKPTRRNTEPGRMHLARLKMAIRYKQKKFCAHANVQQLLASIWYEGLPGFRRRNIVVQILEILFIGFLFPVFAMAYIVAPYSKFGQIIRKPFIKFICHSASYMTFLILLALASQRIETNAFDIFGVSSSSRTITKRGAPPTLIELMVLAWVIGLIWSEIKQLWELGLFDYMSDMWNILDFITNSLYVATITLRVIAYLQVQKEISMHTGTASLPREDWDAFDPILLAEGLFAAANIFSSLKLVYIFSVNPHLGPLQISLGRMVVDILKFFSVYILVLFAFACGMNQLLWYYADMEKQVCFGNTTIITNLTNLRPTAGTFINNANNNNNRRFKFKSLKSANEACLTWRRFANLFESSQTLFWASFGLIDLENFELTGIQSYTRFWGLLMFGSYCVINVVVLLNLLIAMMNHSYQSISEQADTEWKFARTKLWMSYFEDGATVPPPFNVIPTPKSLFYLFKWIVRKFCSQTKFAKNEALKTIRRKARQASERDHRYQNVIRLLVRRYITNEQRIAERKRGVTEDDCNEIKQDISALRFELIELMGRRSNSTGPTGTGLGTSTASVGITRDATSLNATCKPLSGGLGGVDGVTTAGSDNESLRCGYEASTTTSAHSCTLPPVRASTVINRTTTSGCNANGSGSSTLCTCAATLPHHGALPAAQVCTGKRDRQKERRLMKGFDFNCLYLDSATSVDEDCAMLMQGLSSSERQQLLTSNNLMLGNNNAVAPCNKNKSPNRNRFIRLARGIASKRNRPPVPLLSGTAGSTATLAAAAAANAGNNKWKQLIEATRSKVKPFSRSSESMNSELNVQASASGGMMACKNVKKDTGITQLDANVKRSLFARKITSFLKEEHFSVENEEEETEESESTRLKNTTSTSLSKTQSFNSSETPFKGEQEGGKSKNEWI